MCESLLRQNPNLTVSPGLATSWTHPNALTWVYQIRQGVKFWDGHELTPGDVVYSLDRYMDPALGLYWGFVYSSVRSIEQTGPWQVTVRLSSPSNTFQEMMATPAGEISEAAYVKRVGTKAYGTASTGLMCTGPFMLSHWSHGNDIVMVRNPHYWDPAYAPHAQKVTFEFIQNTNTLIEALRSGEIDGAYTLPPGSIAALESATTGKLYSSPVSLGPTFSLDVARDTGPIANPLVREALLLAIPRQAIAQDAFRGQATPLLWKLPPAGARSPAIPEAAAKIYQAALARLPGQTQDLPLARKLFAQAGRPGPIVIEVYQGDSSVLTMATLIQAAGRSIGMNIRLDLVSGAQLGNSFFTASLRKGIDLIWDTGWFETPSPLSDITSYVGPGASVNFGNYHNAQVNADLQVAQATSSATEQAAHLAPVLAAMTRAGIIIPIAASNSLMFLNSRLTGAALSSPYYLNSPWAALIGGSK